MSDVYLVRHAAALSRSSWAEADQLRPLSDAGLRQARALPRHLRGVVFARLLTSPSVRCIQTFEPLAETDGSPLEVVDWLAEGSAAGTVLDRLLDVASIGAVAACTHGDVLSDTLARLAAARVPLEGPLECGKGSTWVLAVQEGSFRRGRYLEPPAVGEPS